MNVLEKLLYHAILLRAAPDHRLILVPEQEADRNHAQIVHRIHWAPAKARLVYTLTGDAHHCRLRRTTDVNVQQADLPVHAREPQGHLRRKRALAHTALAGKHEDLVLDVRQALGDHSHCGVGFCGLARRAELLVRASRAR